MVALLIVTVLWYYIELGSCVSGRIRTARAVYTLPKPKPIGTIVRILVSCYVLVSVMEYVSGTT